MSDKDYIKFWGVRGSNPTPDADKIKYGGDTSCVEIKTTFNDVIILDDGNFFPSMNSRNAPPPVEQYDTSSYL